MRFVFPVLATGAVFQNGTLDPITLSNSTPTPAQSVPGAHTVDIGGTPCATPTATATRIVQHINCRRIVCTRPTRLCGPGEPSAPAPRPPTVIATVTPAPGACTATAEAIHNPGCNLCPTCLPSVAAETAGPAAGPTAGPTVEATPTPTVKATPTSTGVARPTPT